MLTKPVNMQKVSKVFFDVIIVYILYFKHNDFTGQIVQFNDETLRFKHEQTREIVHAL